MYPIPDKIFDSHFCALAKTGAGKSFTFAGIIERLLEHKRRVCVVDPKGDYWGLRSSADGKSAGYPIMLFGDFKRPDLPERLPLNDRAGKEVAKLIVSGNRPAVFGFRGWTEASMIRFYVEFISTLYQSVDAPLNLFIDEMQNFAPKGKILGEGDANKALHWSKRILSEGRGIGLRIGVASQRPQKVHNDVLDCCETLIAMRIVHPRSREAIKEWVDGHGDPERSKEVLNNLAQMKVGEAYVWSPENDFFQRVAFPRIKTYDSYRTPTDAEKVVTPKGWASVNLDEVKERLSSLVQEAKANDPAELKKQLADLKRQVAEQTKLATATSLKAGVKVNVQPLIEKREREIRQEYERQIKSYVEATEKTQLHFERTFKELQNSVSKLRWPEIRWPEPPKLFLSAHSKIDIADITEQLKSIRQTDKGVDIEAGAVAGMRQASNGKLPPGEHKVLTAVCQHPESGVAREQLSVLTGYKRSTRDRYVQLLGQKGFVSFNGDGRILATQEGFQALGPNFRPLPTGQELIEHWLNVLPQGERAIFEILVKAHPNTVSRDEVSNQTNYSRSTRDRYIQLLGARRLVESSNDGVRASKKLFE